MYNGGGGGGRIIVYKCCNIHDSHLELIFPLWDMLSHWKREKGVILNLTPVRGIKPTKKSRRSGGIISGALLIIFLGKCSLAVHLTDLVKQAFLYLPAAICNTESLQLFSSAFNTSLACLLQVADWKEVEVTSDRIVKLNLSWSLYLLQERRPHIYSKVHAAHKHWFSKTLWQQIINIK